MILVQSRMKRSLNELSEDVKNQIYSKKAQPSSDGGHNSSNLYTTGASSRSFTSTTAAPVTSGNDMKKLDDIEQRQPLHDAVRKQKKKGYVQMVTNRGVFNIQLHCDIAPITCDNFLTLATSGYYNGTKFHRLIPNFMLQGGDPSGTGRGGRSAFNSGNPIPDEFDSRLKHDSAGVVSMANTGKRNDNKSQFFITFSKSEHLDNKHTVFGKVVGGMTEFLRLNTTPTSGTDVPLEDIVIEEIIIVENPFRSVVEEKDAKEAREAKERENAVYVKAARSDPMATHPNRFSMEIGKYIDWSAVKAMESTKKPPRNSKRE